MFSTFFYCWLKDYWCSSMLTVTINLYEEAHSCWSISYLFDVREVTACDVRFTIHYNSAENDTYILFVHILYRTARDYKIYQLQGIQNQSYLLDSFVFFFLVFVIGDSTGILKNSWFSNINNCIDSDKLALKYAQMKHRIVSCK